LRASSVAGPATFQFYSSRCSWPSCSSCMRIQLPCKPTKPEGDCDGACCSIVHAYPGPCGQHQSLLQWRRQTLHRMSCGHVCARCLIHASALRRRRSSTASHGRRRRRSSSSCQPAAPPSCVRLVSRQLSLMWWGARHYVETSWASCSRHCSHLLRFTGLSAVLTSWLCLHQQIWLTADIIVPCRAPTC
jgi:hypothetical protein